MNDTDTETETTEAETTDTETTDTETTDTTDDTSAPIADTLNNWEDVARDFRDALTTVESNQNKILEGLNKLLKKKGFKQVVLQDIEEIEVEG